MTRPLLPEHRQLLLHLSDTAYRELSECYGAPLWRLLGEGYAVIEPAHEGREWLRARVKLTPKGFKEALNPGRD